MKRHHATTEGNNHCLSSSIAVGGMGCRGEGDMCHMSILEALTVVISIENDDYYC